MMFLCKGWVEQVFRKEVMHLLLPELVAQAARWQIDIIKAQYRVLRQVMAQPAAFGQAYG
jgi:hypothetical protein